ncbi:uncharacterized protein LOC117114471 [Anneissia japonica]|uniref:uncharacterized protein LOC117114471 n=1 Tax=Anneissia japonica TaxID=1529436 RepID=UPI0014258B06|nr:uncharacterized protein LOC117114471 [Anneissia japonica]
MTEVHCDAGQYRDGVSNLCYPCVNCSNEAYNAGRIQNACMLTEPCPRWCGARDQPRTGEEPHDCAPTTAHQPTTPRPTTDGYTTGLERSTTDFIATNATVTNPPPSYNQTNVAVISVVALLGVAVLFVCLRSCVRKRCHRLRSKY